MVKHNVKIKKQASKGAGVEINLQSLYDTYTKFIELSRYLFGSKNPIYDISEMPGTSDFFTDAVRIAEQLEIDWETMSHEDSNRIMLALLEDYYQAMAKVGKKKDLVIEVTLKIQKKNEN